MPLNKLIYTDTAVLSSAPPKYGRFCVDFTNTKLYCSFGITNPSDWVQIFPIDLSSYVTKTGTETLSNKTIAARIGSITSSAIPSINTDSYDIYRITALAVDITSISFTGTPTHGQKLILEITGTGTRAITPGASISNGAATFPISVSTTLVRVGLMYDSVSTKWRCEAQG